MRSSASLAFVLFALAACGTRSRIPPSGGGSGADMTPECKPVNTACAVGTDCCPGFTCQKSFCKAGPGASPDMARSCGNEGDACGGDTDCCNGLTCPNSSCTSVIPDMATAPPLPCQDPNSMTCTDCWKVEQAMGGSCYATVQKCFNDAGCKAFNTCIVNCAGNVNCQQNCVNNASQNSLTLHDNAVICLNGICPECNVKADCAQGMTCVMHRCQ